jgi:hypothetical protein
VSRWWRFLVSRPTLCGVTYGVIVHTVMNQLVLPMSRVQFLAPPWHVTASMIVIHMLFVGLPIALIVARGRDPGR